MQKKTIELYNYCILDSTCILPGAFKLWVLPVHYQHVWKIRAPLNNIQGRNILKRDCQRYFNWFFIILFETVFLYAFESKFEMCP